MIALEQTNQMNSINSMNEISVSFDFGIFLMTNHFCAGHTMRTRRAIKKFCNGLMAAFAAILQVCQP